MLWTFLLADDSLSNSILAAVVGGTAGMIVAASRFLGERAKDRARERQEARREWLHLTHQLRERIAELTDQLDGLRKAHDEQATSIARNQGRLLRLERETIQGEGSPPEGPG